MNDEAMKSNCQLRRRHGFRVVNLNDIERVPSCEHGPCLLFERKIKEKTVERFFACAVYRSRRQCPFRITLTGSNEPQIDSIPSGILNAPNTTFHYFFIRKKANLLKQKHEDIYYCSTCNDIFEIPHVHSLKGPIDVAVLRKPSQLLVPHTNSDSESQYWFTEESLSVIVKAIEKSSCDGVLCVGTPTVFEYFQSCKKLRKKYKSFLLDIDARFVPFLRSNQFAVYSMLTNHFYDPRSIAKLDKFFESVHGLVMTCDPPFGVIIEALMNSLNTLRKRFLSLKISESKNAWWKSVIVLPIFVGKRFLNRNDFNLLDYKVCYTNHQKYKRSEKSIVRLFTDLPLNIFDLSELPDYRFCDKCEKFVAKTNLHCDSCNACPSENSGISQHCYICDRCVKSTYKHCTICSRCHLPQRCSKSRSGELIFLETIMKKSKKKRRKS